MRDFVVNASVIFTEGFEYVLANGVIIKYEDGYLCDRDGNRISTDDCPVLPMINYHPQVKAGPVQKEKEVWQFEDGEQPKLLSNNYVVETENFKKVGEWIYIKETGGAIPLKIINNRVITYDFPACPGRNGEIITESEKKIILRSKVGGLCMSEEGIYGAVDIVIDHGTVEELLQVLA